MCYTPVQLTKMGDYGKTMKNAYWARFFKDNKGGYSVDVPDLPGCITWGQNMEEAYGFLINQAIPLWLEEQPWPEARIADEIIALPKDKDKDIQTGEPLLVRVSIRDVGGPIVDTWTLWPSHARDMKRKNVVH